MRRIALLALLLVSRAATSAAATYVVAASGGDFTAIQPALNVAVAGDTVLVHEKPTPYFEKVMFPASGNEVDGFITLAVAAGEHPVIDGTGVASTGGAGENMVLIDSRSWVKVIGFEIRNDLGVSDGSGVRVLGAGSHIEIRANHIHDVRGQNAMGITVYGTAASPISDLVIDGNEIEHCEPAPSEALTLNGNITDFEVTDNSVHDVDNIGIDFIGGETDIQPDAAKVARNGICRGNRVARARSSYGGGFAGGIYVDGGASITIENNVVTESDLGLEVGAENRGIVTTGVIVRDNVLIANDKTGLVFGGFASSVGRVRGCAFLNNTLYRNDTLGSGFGELWIQYAEDNVVRNNVIVAAQRRLLTSDAGNVGNALDYNLWFTAADVEPRPAHVEVVARRHDDPRRLRRCGRRGDELHALPLRHERRRAALAFTQRDPRRRHVLEPAVLENQWDERAPLPRPRADAERRRERAPARRRARRGERHRESERPEPRAAVAAARAGPGGYRAAAEQRRRVLGRGVRGAGVAQRCRAVQRQTRLSAAADGCTFREAPLRGRDVILHYC